MAVGKLPFRGVYVGDREQLVQRRAQSERCHEHQLALTCTLTCAQRRACQ